jgi:tetratricopeptide (TPR) repeat protein
MKMLCRGIALAVLLAVVGAQPAAADTQEEKWDRCLRQNRVGPQTPEETIAACRFVLTEAAYYDNIRADAFNNIGISYMEMGQYDDAIHSYGDALRAIRERQNLPEFVQLANYTRRNRAHAYQLTGRYDDAMADIDKMVSTEAIPKYIAMRCRAHALWDTDFNAALADCKKAMDADKHLADAYAGWLIVEYRQGKYADMIGDCKMVLDQAIFSTDVVYVCGLAEKRAGNAERGRMMVQDSEAAVPDVAATFKKLGILP